MNTRQLLGILNSPWMIEPNAAQQWAEIAYEIIYKGGTYASVPTKDTRWMYSGVYKVNPKGETDYNGAVQIIGVQGPMMKYGFCGSPGSQDLQQSIRAAANDNAVDAIVLDMDTPGGQVDGTDNLAREVREARKIKPVVTLINNMCCSAGYWVGCQADEVIVDSANGGHLAVIGSIGTMAMWKDLSKMEEKAGIVTHIVTASASKDKNKMFEEANAGKYDKIRDHLNALNDTFLAAVRQSRGDKLSKSEDVLTGKTYNGLEGIKYGLADRMGNFQMAVSRAYFLSKNKHK